LAQARTEDQKLPFQQHALAICPLPVSFPAMRVRDDMDGEMRRIHMQVAMVFGTITSCNLLAGSLYLGVMPWWVPLRCYEDTLGPFTRVRNLQPPLMDRARYETPDNLWHPLVFPADTPAGQLQDLGFGLWNWGMLAVYEGPLYMKAFALCVAFVCSLPGLMYVQGKMARVDDTMGQLPRFIKVPYLLVMPEWLLVLEQLFAAKDYGRKVSPEILAYMAAFEQQEADQGAKGATAMEEGDLVCATDAAAVAETVSRRRHNAVE